MDRNGASGAGAKSSSRPENVPPIGHVNYQKTATAGQIPVTQQKKLFLHSYSSIDSMQHVTRTDCDSVFWRCSIPATALSKRFGFSSSGFSITVGRLRIKRTFKERFLKHVATPFENRLMPEAETLTATNQIVRAGFFPCITSLVGIGLRGVRGVCGFPGNGSSRATIRTEKSIRLRLLRGAFHALTVVVTGKL